MSTDKQFWWNTELDVAFDKYYDLGYYSGSVSMSEKEYLFSDILYPAFKVLASSIIVNNNWHEILHCSQDDLMNDVVAFAWSIGPTFKNTRKASRYRSSCCKIVINDTTSRTSHPQSGLHCRSNHNRATVPH